MRKRKRNDSNVELAVDDVLCGRKTIDQTCLAKHANLANEQVDDYVDKIRKKVHFVSKFYSSIKQANVNLTKDVKWHLKYFNRKWIK